MLSVLLKLTSSWFYELVNPLSSISKRQAYIHCDFPDRVNGPSGGPPIVAYTGFDDIGPPLIQATDLEGARLGLELVQEFWSGMDYTLEEAEHTKPRYTTVRQSLTLNTLNGRLRSVFISRYYMRIELYGRPDQPAGCTSISQAGDANVRARRSIYLSV
jgi:hypothetical protein